MTGGSAMPSIYGITLTTDRKADHGGVRRLVAYAVIALVLTSASVSSAQASPAVLRAALEGQDATASQAAEWELRLQEAPDDIAARVKLIEYYEFLRFLDKDTAQRRERHIIWLIENVPEHPFLFTPAAWILDPTRPATEEVLDLWRRHLKKQPDSIAIIVNAAEHLLRRNHEEAIALLERAKQLEPGNPRWHQLLARAHMIVAKRSLVHQQQEHARAAVREREAAMEMATQEWHRTVQLPDLAEAALMAGDMEKAANAARRYQDTAPPGKDGLHAASVHRTHIVLGKVALTSGDKEKAIKHLLASASISEAMRIRVTGPDLALARSLLAAGERVAVREYLERCKQFWPDGAAVLGHWQRDIDAGITPSFDPMDRLEF